MMYALDQSRQEEAIKLATTLEKVEGINIKVTTTFASFKMMSVDTSFILVMTESNNIFSFFQNCSRVLQALQAGDFGSCSQHLEEYKTKCHKIMKYATLFRPPTPPVLNEIVPSENTSLEIPVPEVSN